MSKKTKVHTIIYTLYQFRGKKYIIYLYLNYYSQEIYKFTRQISYYIDIYPF